MASPLTKDDKAKIDSALKAIADTKKDIEKAKLAGIDVSSQEAALKSTEAQLQSIRRVYFPAQS